MKDQRSSWTCKYRCVTVVSVLVDVLFSLGPNELVESPEDGHCYTQDTSTDESGIIFSSDFIRISGTITVY